jgi:hypothetical protein
VNASVRGKQKAWRLSLVAEDDLIARALILQEFKHQPFLDLLDDIGEREVFAVLIDAVDARSEFLDSAIAAADRIRVLQAAEDATAMQHVIGLRDGLEEEISTKERIESSQRKAAQELSKAVRNERAGRRRAVALEIKDWLAREQGANLRGLPGQVRQIIERIARHQLEGDPDLRALHSHLIERRTLRQGDWDAVPGEAQFRRWLKARKN